MGQYLRSLREERGMTVRELARAVGLPESSASYISQLEMGAKAPNPELAVLLGQQLRDRQGIFRLWAMTSPRANDPRTVASALRELARLLGDPSIAPDSLFDDYRRARIEQAREALASRHLDMPEWSEAMHDADVVSQQAVPPAAEPPQRTAVHLRLEAREPAGARIPLLEEHEVERLHGPDGPDDAVLHERGFFTRLFRGERAMLRLESEAAATLPLEGAFACRIGPRLRDRVTHLLAPGDVAVCTREVLPLVAQDIYLVHSHAQRRLVLSLVLHNGEQLLLLPDHGRSDFEVLPARGEAQLRRLLVAHVARVIRYPK